MKDLSFLQYIDIAHVLSGLGSFVAQLDAHPTGGLILVCLAFVFFNRRRTPAAPVQATSAHMRPVDRLRENDEDE